MELKQIEQETQKAVSEVLEQAKLKMGDLFVIGCSTSAAVRSNTAVLYALSRRACGGEELPGLLRRGETACIGCGRCAEICPVSLIPSELFRITELLGETGMREVFLHRDGGFCIGCGCCTYVCPSSLPLAEEIAAAQRRICVGNDTEEQA